MSPRFLDDNAAALAGLVVALGVTAAAGLYRPPAPSLPATTAPEAGASAASSPGHAGAGAPAAAKPAASEAAFSATPPAASPSAAVQSILANTSGQPSSTAPIVTPVSADGSNSVPVPVATVGPVTPSAAAERAQTRLPLRGPVEPPPPYFQFRRPFEPPLENRPGRFYPYGTTADGEYLLHHGIDIGNVLGTPVRAVAAGRVVFAGSDIEQSWGPMTDFYGNLVVIDHGAVLDGRPLYSLYGHLSEVNAAANARVAVGEVIGLVGAAGIALGPHLHLELRTDARDYEATLNPELFLAPLPGRGTIVGRVVDRRLRPIPEVEVGLYAIGGDGSREWTVGTWTYPDEHMNSSEFWRDNYLFGDTPAGSYAVVATINGRRLTTSVTVTAGAVGLAELRYVP